MNNIGTQLIARHNIRTIVAKRDAIIDAYSRAFQAIVEAKELAETIPVVCSPAPSLRTVAQSVYDIKDAATLETGVDVVTRHLDGNIWAYILELSGMISVMAADDKVNFGKVLEQNPPPVTLENIQSSASMWAASSGDTFRKGLVSVFSKLQKKFKTHDSFKIDKKVILSYSVKWCSYSDCYEWYTSSFSDSRDEIRDLDRIFHVLDGLPAPTHIKDATTVIAQVWRDEKVAAAKTKYFAVKPFKNGNIHLTFTRPDLVVKANLLIAEHFGQTLAHDEE